MVAVVKLRTIHTYIKPDRQAHFEAFNDKRVYNEDYPTSIISDGGVSCLTLVCDKKEFK